MGNPLAHRPHEYLIGVDIGQTTDPSAIAVLQRVPLIKMLKRKGDLGEDIEVPSTRDEWVSSDSQVRSYEYVDHFYLRQMERLPLHTPYANVVGRVETMVGKLPPYASLVVVDQTGVGRPVAEMMYHLPIAPVTITAGQSVGHDHDGWKVAKRVLVSNAQVLLQNRRLLIAKGIRYRDEFINEMLSFRVKTTDAGNKTYDPDRSGKHDDMVLATCLAVWWGTQRQTGWLPVAPYPDLDEDGNPHPKAGQPQDLPEAMLDSGLVAARKKFDPRG